MNRLPVQSGGCIRVISWIIGSIRSDISGITDGVAMDLELAHQPRGDREPGVIGDDLLAAASFERQDLQSFFVAIDQAAE